MSHITLRYLINPSSHGEFRQSSKKCIRLCSAYKATQANDPAAVERVAQEWSRLFNSEVKPEYIWCDGCMSASDRKCGNCAGCGIRVNVVEHGIANCASCADYACDNITKFFDMFPEAKQKLDEIGE